MTVQFTVVVPIAKVEPDAGTQTAGIGPSSTSLPGAVNITTAPAALVAGVVMCRRRERRRVVRHRDRERSGRARTMMSVTRAVHRRGADREGRSPDGRVQTAAIGPSSMSLPDATNVTTAPAALVAGRRDVGRWRERRRIVGHRDRKRSRGAETAHP